MGGPLRDRHGFSYREEEPIGYARSITVFTVPAATVAECGL